MYCLSNSDHDFLHQTSICEDQQLTFGIVDNNFLAYNFNGSMDNKEEEWLTNNKKMKLLKSGKR